MALDETTRWIIGTVVAILGVAAAFVGAKYIRQNRQSQKIGDRGTGIQANDYNKIAGQNLDERNYSPTEQSANNITNNNFHFYGLSEHESQSLVEKSKIAGELIDSRIQSKLRSIGEEIDQETLNDLDFQINIRNAKISCAKNDSDDLKDRLVNLILSRSKQKSNTRLSHILNKAIEISYKLTDQEISVLVVLFLFGHTSSKGLPIEQFIDSIKSYIDDHIKHFPNDPSCIEYLKGEGCVQQRVMSSEFWVILMNSYAGSLSYGFSPSEYADALNGFAPTPDAQYMLTSAKVAGQTKWRFMVESRVSLEKSIPNSWPDATRAGLLNLFDSKLMPLDIVRPRILNEIPTVKILEDNWVSSGASGAFLLPLGKTIAYSALKGTGGLDSPIETWVQ